MGRLRIERNENAEMGIKKGWDLGEIKEVRNDNGDKKRWDMARLRIVRNGNDEGGITRDGIWGDKGW